MIGMDDAALVAVITGIVELVKGAGFPSRFSPVLALLLGLGAGYFYVSPDAQGIFSGIVMGLAAVGLYSGPKNLARGDK
jgi:hypothetical protein